MKNVFSILSIVLFASACNATQWPVVKESKLIVAVDLDSEIIDIRIPIYDESGNPIYWFMCKGGNTEYLDKISELMDVHYVGPLLCRLDVENRESEYSLLTDGQSAIWYSKGHFSLSELSGKCADHPSWGRKREFKVRGLNLLLDIQKLKAPHKELDNYYLLNFNVKNDVTAVNEWAENPNIALKRPNC